MIEALAARVRPLAALRHRTLCRHRDYLDRPEALASQQAYLAASLTQPGVRLRRLGPAGAPRAFVVQRPVGENWTGRPYLQALADADPEDPDALRWLGSTLAELALARPREYLLELDIAYRSVLPQLAQVGLGLDSITLVGRPEPALAALVAHRDPPTDLGHLGLTISRLRRPHVDAAIALKARVFGAEPQWAWFGAWPEHLAQTRAEMLASVDDSDTLAYAIHAGPRLVGMFSTHIEADAPWWGRCAGMDLLLAPEIQGQGVVWTAYRVLLERLVRRGVRVFKGGTAQPAVMALSKVMRRRVRSLTIRPRPALPWSHFALHLPEPYPHSAITSRIE